MQTYKLIALIFCTEVGGGIDFSCKKLYLLSFFIAKRRVRLGSLREEDKLKRRKACIPEPLTKNIGL